MRRARQRGLAAGLALALVLAACGDDDDSGESADTTTGAAEETTAGGAETTAAGEAAETSAEEGAETTAAEGEGGGAGWTADTEACPDDSANEPIEGTVKIGSAMPLSGGPAVAFAPVAEGFDLYIDYANEQGILPGYTIEGIVEDDQYKAELTLPAVEKLLDEDQVNLFSAIIGSPNNLAVRDLLNEECYPHLNAMTGSEAWGEAEDYPWTTGMLNPYPVEAVAYLTDIQTEFPDGATAALFTVNSEFGDSYKKAFTKAAPDYGVEIVAEQTIEAADSNPPTSQVTAIAAQKPEVIMAVPLGAQCPTFLAELANAKAANAGWDPKVYMTGTCASKLFLDLAGAAGQGVITSNHRKDSNDPKFASDPGVKEFLDAYTAAGLSGDPGTTSAGWEVAQVTVEILRQAAESEAGLTRASIIEAARNFEYTSGIQRDGLTLQMNGTEDPYLNEQLQVLEWDAANQVFIERGEPQTEFEGRTAEFVG